MRIITGECVETMNGLPACSVASVVTDPPYDLAFMNKGWDRRGVAFDPTTWAAALRVLVPGGHLLAFGGARTHHRMMVAIEDAGFEIRDCLMWLYGSGFPKSLDVSKAIDKAAGAPRDVVEERRPLDSFGHRNRVFVNEQRGGVDHGETQRITAPATDLARQWDGWGTALKPAYEPIILARKPLAGTVAETVEQWGAGALNIDGCRIPHAGDADLAESTNKNRHGDFGSRPLDTRIYGEDWRERENYDGAKGRWPANVMLDEDAAAMLDAAVGHLHGSGNKRDTGNGTDAGYAASGYEISYAGRANRDYGSAGGGPSRFFYVAKASRAERNAGLSGMPVRLAASYAGGERVFGDVDGLSQKFSARKQNHHPTVKPVALMRWLVRLVTPPSGTVLDPFCGSGSTGVACVAEGVDFLGIDQSAEYCEITRRRIAHAQGPTVAEVSDA